MGKIESVLRAEVVRLAKRQVRAACQPLGREVRALKRRVSELAKAVRAFEPVAKEAAAKRAEEAAVLQAEPAEVEKARMTGGLIKKLRARLGLSQADLGKLLGVTGAAVVFWEQGRSKPAPEKKVGLVALRKLGRRDVKRLLAAGQ
ncbi:MAG: helix-turn-helix domain-containing protein [Planctomycetes bacterium]|nr:helix-turn-helix domain-containing protein [Planctomycetota bacterium]